MSIKHRVRINIKDSEGKEQLLLAGADRWLPQKLIRWLFGEYTQVFLLKPGRAIDSVEVKEIEETEKTQEELEGKTQG